MASRGSSLRLVRSRLRPVLISLGLAVTMLVAVPLAAHADPPPGGPIWISGVASCDPQTREATVYWGIYNPNPVAATLGQVQAFPAAVGEYPVRVPAQGSVHGVQRIGRYGTYAGIALHATFDDLTLTKASAVIHVKGC